MKMVWRMTLWFVHVRNVPLLEMFHKYIVYQSIPNLVLMDQFQTVRKKFRNF